MTFPHLSKAPIVEAIIDIQVPRLPDDRLTQLETFARGIEDQFPTQKKRRSAQAELKLTADGIRVGAPPTQEDGFLFYSPHSEGQFIAQARLDGFTLSRLRPYHNGDEFRAQAKKLWLRYVSLVSPTKVTRVAVRNVNRIEHSVADDLEATILTGPNIARALPQTLNDYFLRLSLADLVSGGTVVVTQALAEINAEAGTVAIIFDIDAFIETSLEPEAPEVWSVIDDLREAKNRVFFNSLTVAAIERHRHE